MLNMEIAALATAKASDAGESDSAVIVRVVALVIGGGTSLARGSGARGALAANE